jgi:hypothetical protein
MANWMKQTVTIYSEKKDKLETIKDYLKTDSSTDEMLIFDLNNLVKMPEELLGITCMTTNEKGKMIDIYYRQEEAKDFMDSIMSAEQDKKVDAKDMFKKLKSIQLDEITIKRLEKKYGSVYWYDWCNDNWGTKWNAWCLKVKEEEIISKNTKQDNLFMLIYEIETAWSPPFGCMPNFFKYVEDKNCTAKWICEPDLSFDSEAKDSLTVRSFKEAAVFAKDFLSMQKALRDSLRGDL